MHAIGLKTAGVFSIKYHFEQIIYKKKVLGLKCNMTVTSQSCFVYLYSYINHKCMSACILYIYIYIYTAKRVWLFQPQFWSSQFQVIKSS